MNALTAAGLARRPASAPRREARWLASVRTPAEAAIALAAGAAIIDAKEPRAGALGALPLAVTSAIAAAVAGRAPVSATVGDLPFTTSALAPAMLATAAAGADIVKIGVFGAPASSEDAEAWLDAGLAALPGELPHPAGCARRVAVLMADQGGAALPLAPFARHGFAGVMLDTADKSRGSLAGLLAVRQLQDFVDQAQALGLWAGLAGSLAAGDIPALLPLGADYLGFRTALCRDGRRGGELDPQACQRLAQLVAPECAAGRAPAR